MRAFGALFFLTFLGGMAMEDAQKTELFESMPIPRAVMKLAIPTVLSSLVMVL